MKARLFLFLNPENFSLSLISRSRLTGNSARAHGASSRPLPGPAHHPSPLSKNSSRMESIEEEEEMASVTKTKLFFFFFFFLWCLVYYTFRGICILRSERKRFCWTLVRYVLAGDNVGRDLFEKKKAIHQATFFDSIFFQVQREHAQPPLCVFVK